NRMTVEPGDRIYIDFVRLELMVHRQEQVAGGLLISQQIFQPPPHGLAVLVVVMIVARAEEGQKRQACCCGVGAINADVSGRRAGEVVQAPASVGRLHLGKVREASLDSLLGAAFGIAIARAAWSADFARAATERGRRSANGGVGGDFGPATARLSLQETPGAD